MQARFGGRQLGVMSARKNARYEADGSGCDEAVDDDLGDYSTRPRTGSNDCVLIHRDTDAYAGPMYRLLNRGSEMRTVFGYCVPNTDNTISL